MTLCLRIVSHYTRLVNYLFTNLLTYFADFFTSKVDNVLASTSSAPPFVIKKQPVATPFSSFEPVSIDEVTRLLSRIPAKHCLLDPVPTWLVKCVSDVLAPVLSAMCPCRPEVFLTHRSQLSFFHVLESLKCMLRMPTDINQY